MIQSVTLTYIEKLEGKKAVLEINIPELNTRNANVTLPTWIPNSRHTLLQNTGKLMVYCSITSVVFTNRSRLHTPHTTGPVNSGRRRTLEVDWVAGAGDKPMQEAHEVKCSCRNEVHTSESTPKSAFLGRTTCSDSEIIFKCVLCVHICQCVHLTKCKCAL
jgi:hypothetical protein